jgi:hypothetical protein
VNLAINSLLSHAASTIELGRGGEQQLLQGDLNLNADGDSDRKTESR